MLADQLDDLVVADLPGAEGIQGDGRWLRHADGVGHLDLAFLSQASSDNILGHVTAGIGRGTVDLGRVLAGEGAAAVTGHAAVGVDDDLATGQAAVAHRAADHELASRVDVELGILVQQLRRQSVLDDQFHDGFFQICLGHVFVVLGGQNNGVDAGDLAVFIATGDLAFRVGAQPWQQAAFAGFGLALYQTVREGNRGRHQYVGFVAGVAEHQALVAGALVFRLLAVNALGDVHGLLADDVDNAAGVTVVAHGRGGVADVLDHAAHQVFQIHPGAGGDFPTDDSDPGLYHGFARNPGMGVVDQNGVEDGIGNLVSQFIRVAFRDRFGGKDAVIRHRVAPL